MLDPSSDNPDVAEAFADVISEVEKPAEESDGPFIAFSHVNIAFDEVDQFWRTSALPSSVGKPFVFCSRSGVGKSVTLRILMGFLKPDSGSVRVENEEITELDEEGMRAIRKRVTMVFQNGALFDSLSVRENVAFSIARAGEVSPRIRWCRSLSG